MKRAGLLLPFLTLILNAQKVTAQEKRTITPEDMVNIRMVYDANVSPDGKSVAFVISEPADPNKPANARDENIWIVPTDGSEPAHLFASSPKSENFPRWSSDGRWLAFLSNRRQDGQAQI